jgi:hypothetical protein
VTFREGKKDVAQQLRRTLAEEERRQLAQWLDQRHKVLQDQLKGLGADAKSPKRRPLPKTAEPNDMADVIQIIGRRMQARQRPHIHHLEYLDDDTNDDDTTRCVLDDHRHLSHETPS